MLIGLKSNLVQIMRAKSKRLASTLKEVDQPSCQWQLLNSDVQESGLREGRQGRLRGHGDYVADLVKPMCLDAVERISDWPALDEDDKCTTNLHRTPRASQMS